MICGIKSNILTFKNLKNHDKWRSYSKKMKIVIKLTCVLNSTGGHWILQTSQLYSMAFNFKALHVRMMLSWILLTFWKSVEFNMLVNGITAGFSFILPLINRIESHWSFRCIQLVVQLQLKWCVIGQLNSTD